MNNQQIDRCDLYIKVQKTTSFKPPASKIKQSGQLIWSAGINLFVRGTAFHNYNNIYVNFVRCAIKTYLNLVMVNYIFVNKEKLPQLYSLIN